MKSPLLWGAAAVVLVANAVVLSNVAQNRRGQPTNLISLTSRELPVRPADPEGGLFFTGIAYQEGSILEWFDARKLASLGFDMSVAIDDPAAQRHYRRQRARQVFVVLEYDGEAAKQWRSQHEARILSTAPGQNRTTLENEREWHTRLFAIDVSADYASARARYPDLHKYLIVPCTAGVSFWEESARGKLNRYVRGYLGRLLVGQIHVPARFAAELIGPRRPEVTWSAPAFEVTLRYGQRFEPEMVQLKRREPLPAGTR